MSDTVLPSDPKPAAVEMVPGGPVSGQIMPPGSKSLTNRALICAAFAQGKSQLTGALQSEDTEVMIESLRRIGVEVSVSDRGRTLDVDPGNSNGEKSASTIEMFIANSGTSIRFLTAALSAHGGRYHLSGVPRMHERPIGDLVRAIDPIIDGTISTQSDQGCPPVVIEGAGWKHPQLSVAGGVSSQYLSGLMMACPIAQAARTRTAGQAQTAWDDSAITIAVAGELVSRPYVDMTAQVMNSFGADVTVRDNQGESVSVVVENASYRGTNYSIEPDASAASYFWAAAAISGGEITVQGLTGKAMQGDVGFVDVLEKMGCQVRRGPNSTTVIAGQLRGVDVDMNAISDTVQTLSIVALFADGPTRVRGVAHNRFKETDRIGDLATELRKLGAQVDEHEDGMTIVPPKEWQSFEGATLETYHDHRMAMSLALAGLKMRGVKILDPSCTSKTYPEFFHDLEKLTGRAHLWAS